MKSRFWIASIVLVLLLVFRVGETFAKETPVAPNRGYNSKAEQEKYFGRDPLGLPEPQKGMLAAEQIAYRGLVEKLDIIADYLHDEKIIDEKTYSDLKEISKGFKSCNVELKGLRAFCKIYFDALLADNTNLTLEFRKFKIGQDAQDKKIETLIRYWHEAECERRILQAKQIWERELQVKLGEQEEKHRAEMLDLKNANKKVSDALAEVENALEATSLSPPQSAIVPYIMFGGCGTIRPQPFSIAEWLTDQDSTFQGTFGGEAGIGVIIKKLIFAEITGGFTGQEESIGHFTGGLGVNIAGFKASIAALYIEQKLYPVICFSSDNWLNLFTRIYPKKDMSFFQLGLSVKIDLAK